MKGSKPIYVVGAAVVLAGALFLTIPNSLPSTYVALLGLLIGAGTVTLLTWRSALPTDTVGQLLHRTEHEQTRRKRS
jgi:hypothetical protein